MALTPKLSKEMSISYGGDVIALTTDFDLEINKESIDVTTLDSAGWREKLVDLKDWKISFSGLQGKGTVGAGEAGWDELLTSLKGTDTPVQVIMSSTDTGDWIETGNAFLVSLKMSGSVGDKITFSGELEGTGALTTSQVA